MTDRNGQRINSNRILSILCRNLISKAVFWPFFRGSSRLPYSSAWRRNSLMTMRREWERAFAVETGLILTSNHVVESHIKTKMAQWLQLWLPARPKPMPYQVAGYLSDPLHNLCLL
jgi:hypothetical protein